MKYTSVNLHTEYKRTLLTIVLFSLLSLFLNFLILISLNSDFAQLNSLWCSDYIYSATMKEPVGQDDYYQLNAGICFSLSANAETSLNADVVMQPFKSEYSEQVYWNADQLSTYGLAISKGIAKENDLDIGDKLYSKRVIDGEICEYTVEQIVPEVSNVRVTKQKNYSNGIIIMGYDNVYIDNISKSALVFTKEPIDSLAGKFADMPVNIIYRDNEIFAVCKRLLPYVGIYTLLSAVCTVGLVLFLTKNIKYNFRRLIVLGFSKRELNRAYNRNIGGLGILSIMCVFLTTMIVLCWMKIYQNEVFLLGTISFIDFVTLIITAALSRRRLWRK